MNQVQIAGRKCGGGAPLLWIVGPCVIESRDFILKISEQIAQIVEQKKLQLIFKSSFDKANRSSGKSFRGPGLEEGLRILEEVRRNTGLPITTDVHETSQAAPAGSTLR